MTACLSPLHIRSENGIISVVPCGRCDACLVRSRQEWTYRLREELKDAKSCYFITLTYDDEHLPIQESVEKDSGACYYDAVNSVKDIQLFNKRFRHKLEKYDTKCRYYIISEYGPRTLRPHYHGIYFLNNFLDLDIVDNVARACWTSPIVTVDYITDYRIKYVTEYCFTRKDIPDNLPANIRLVSRNPGLGYNYIKRMEKWHLSDMENRVIAPEENGNRCNLPRYYREKIYPKEFLAQRASRLSGEKFQAEYDMFNEPDFDAEKYFRDERQKKIDYHNKVTRYIKKHKLHKPI